VKRILLKKLNFISYNNCRGSWGGAGSTAGGMEFMTGSFLHPVLTNKITSGIKSSFFIMKINFEGFMFMFKVN
jgi:hypothetical protein